MPKAKVDRFEQRRLQREAEAAAKQQAAAAADIAVARAAGKDEITVYLELPAVREAVDFSVPAWWNEKGPDKIDVETGAVLEPAPFPKLSRLAALVLGVDSTSCQAERNFSALAYLLDNLRASMAPWTVEMCMLLRLNRGMVKGIDKLLAHAEERHQTAAATRQRVAAAQGAVTAIVID